MAVPLFRSSPPVIYPNVYEIGCVTKKPSRDYSEPSQSTGTGTDSQSTLIHLEMKGVLRVMQPLSFSLVVSARDDIPI